MQEYVASTGPLRGFEHLYDGRLDRLPDIGGFQVLELTIKGEGNYLTEYKRQGRLEWVFIHGFFDAVAIGKPVIYGLRDVEKAVAAKLAQRLEKAQEMPFAAMKYFTCDDDLVLSEITHFRDQLQWVNDLYPPRDGHAFFYLSRGFAAAESYWKSAAHGSQQAKADPFLRDFFWQTVDSPVLLLIDERGTIDIAFSPKFKDEEKIKRCVAESALKADMKVTYAPSLFG